MLRETGAEGHELIRRLQLELGLPKLRQIEQTSGSNGQLPEGAVLEADIGVGHVVDGSTNAHFHPPEDPSDPGAVAQRVRWGNEPDRQACCLILSRRVPIVRVTELEAF